MLFPPSSCNLPAFTFEFETLLKEAIQYEIYILGDLNIDLLEFSEHLLSEEYLTMRYSHNLLPLITKPTGLAQGTHTSTLIDHIYINSNLSVDAGMCWLMSEIILLPVLGR